ncbi:hypothetical protein WG66_002140 [Moniliophthora roreri]|nr:hypothetical protein WG66_002140 [Moniliophthora roreri]
MSGIGENGTRTLRREAKRQEGIRLFPMAGRLDSKDSEHFHSTPWELDSSQSITRSAQNQS